MTHWATPGFYDAYSGTFGTATAKASQIVCYETSQRWQPLVTPPTEQCLPCTGLPCVDCSALGSTVVRPGFGVSTKSLTQGVPFQEITGQRVRLRTLHARTSQGGSPAQR